MASLVVLISKMMFMQKHTNTSLKTENSGQPLRCLPVGSMDQPTVRVACSFTSYDIESSDPGVLLDAYWSCEIMNQPTVRV